MRELTLTNEKDVEKLIDMIDPTPGTGQNFQPQNPGECHCGLLRARFISQIQVHLKEESGKRGSELGLCVCERKGWEKGNGVAACHR